MFGFPCDCSQWGLQASRTSQIAAQWNQKASLKVCARTGSAVSQDGSSCSHSNASYTVLSQPRSTADICDQGCYPGKSTSRIIIDKVF